MKLKTSLTFLFNHHHIKRKEKQTKSLSVPPGHRQIEQQFSPSPPYKINSRLIKLLVNMTHCFPSRYSPKEMNFILEDGSKPALPGTLAPESAWTAFLASTCMLVISAPHNSPGCGKRWEEGQFSLLWIPCPTSQGQAEHQSSAILLEKPLHSFWVFWSIWHPVGSSQVLVSCLL